MYNILSHATIRSHTQSIEDFNYRAGRIFLILDPQADHRRVHWVRVLYVF